MWRAAVFLGLVVAAGSCGGGETSLATSSSSSAPTTVVATTTTTIPPTTTTTRAPTTTTTTTLPPTAPARYRLTVDNNWAEDSHPGAVPGNAHFSWLAGATHDEAVSIWTVGSPSSPGVTEMAETGVTDILVGEINALDGVGSTLDWPWWFCPDATTNAKCGDLVVEFEVDPDHPYVTLAAMIGPSPDWFVGVDGLPLLEDGQWKSEVTIVLTPLDGGTRSSNRLALFGPQNSPPGPISRVTEESGQLIGPQAIGTYTFELLPEA